ncbi:hypothetical protein LOS22_03505 [Enterococcus faecium]|nr:hypothetical protein [Enterococcus faecium]
MVNKRGHHLFFREYQKFILHLLAEVPNQIDKVDFSDEISGTRQIKAMEKKRSIRKMSKM